MDRLTGYDKAGTPFLRNATTTGMFVDNDLDGIYVSPVEWLAALRKLAAYEDAETSGLLHRMPCPIGTPVFFIRRMDYVYQELVYEVNGMDYSPNSSFTAPEDFEEYWFLTQEEAEDALRIWTYVEKVIDHGQSPYKDQEDAYLFALHVHRHLAWRKGEDNGGTAQA